MLRQHSFVSTFKVVCRLVGIFSPLHSRKLQLLKNTTTTTTTKKKKKRSLKEIRATFPRCVSVDRFRLLLQWYCATSGILIK